MSSLKLKRGGGGSHYVDLIKVKKCLMFLEIGAKCLRTARASNTHMSRQEVYFEKINILIQNSFDKHQEDLNNFVKRNRNC